MRRESRRGEPPGPTFSDPSSRLRVPLRPLRLCGKPLLIRPQIAIRRESGSGEPMLRAGECTLTFAGQSNVSSPYVQEFLKSAAALPGVELPGFIGRDELGAQFGRASLLVLPTFEDNCPMVVLEAMAAGLPVAASRVGGVPDLITHEKDGLMFDPNDPADVRACLERLVRDPETRASFGIKGRITASERFHPKVIAERHLKIYQEVLNR